MKKNKKIKNTIKKGTLSGKNRQEKVPSISICMIVKDEERFLDNCLNSVKEIADEIIVVDTGSQDRTVEIAKRYTDNVYFHPWNNNFSEARNHSIEHATGDWIFIIDADEELIKENIHVIRKAIQNPEIDAIMAQVISNFKKGKNEARHHSERIFRNNGLIHYEGRVHNRLTGVKNPKIYPIHIIHYGYDLEDKELSEKKHVRRISLLKKDIEEYPNNPLPYHYLSCCYLSHAQYSETLDASLKAIELSVKFKNENYAFLWSRYNAAMAYYRLKDFKKAKSMALSAIALEKSHLDSYFVLTLVNFDESDWDAVIEHGNKYIELCDKLKENPEDFGTIVFNTPNESWNVFVLTGIAYEEKGLPEKAKTVFKSSISNAYDSFLPVRAIGIYYFQKKRWAEASEHLKKAFKINKKDQTVNDLLDKTNKATNSNTTISCCMIVKNEEGFLKNCLSSIKNEVDEIIIVDTGSTDNTVEIAKEFTDKIYFHPWENNFSKSRNQALQYATSDWIFIIDADEELIDSNNQKLHSELEKVKDADIIFIKVISKYANSTKKATHNSERLFRNNGKICYEGSVHNRVVGGTKAYYTDIELLHFGYDLDEEKAEDKFIRTTTLLIKEIEKEPANPLPRHYLSASYLSKRMFEEAIAEAKKAIELADIQNNKHAAFSWSHFIVSRASLTLGLFDQAKEYAHKALDKYPGHLDSYYMLTVISSENGSWSETNKFGKLFLDTLKKYQDDSSKAGQMINNTMNEGTAINILLGHSCHAMKDLHNMECYYKKAYDITNDKWQVWWNIGIYHMDKSFDMDRAGHFLKLAVKEAPDEYQACYMLAKYYSKYGFTEDEMEALEKVIEIGTQEDFITNRLFSLYLKKEAYNKALELLNSSENLNISIYPDILKLGNNYMEKGHLEHAMKCYMKAAEIQPNSPEAWSILAEITFTLEKYEDSQIFLEKALDLKVDDIKNLLAMCALKLKLGDIESHIKYCDKLLNCLDLNKDRTINGFDDLKELFIEIENSMDNGTNHSSRINYIINELNLYISPAAQ